MLIETDAPYLAPVPFRGKTNQPAYVRYVAEEIARLRELAVDEVAAATSANFFRLFGVATRCALTPSPAGWAPCFAHCACSLPCRRRAVRLNDAFVQAVELDRSDEVRAMLARGSDPNTVDANGDSVLLIAARAGWQPTARCAACRRGEGRRAESGRGYARSWSPRSAVTSRSCARSSPAVRRSTRPAGPRSSMRRPPASVEVLRYLLDVGANVNATSANGTTALMMAVRGGYDTSVELLLSRGADVNHRNENGATALSWATRGAMTTIERSLRAHGASN